MLRRYGVVFGSKRLGRQSGGARRVAPAWLRRFVRRQEGATAIEFGIVLLPFLSILLMTMETALVFFAQQTLETAVSDSSRLILTGQAKTFDAAKFKAAVCERVVALFDCSGNMYIDVQTASNFASIDNTIKTDSSGNPKTNYNPGATGQISVVRLIYKWPIFSPLTQPFLATGTGGTRMLVATAAFRNEPF